MNFAVHVALFAAVNSGVWFFRTVQAATWPWAVWLTGGWLLALIAHAIYIFAIASYSEPGTPSSKNS
jgi:hypothetical protein